MKHGKKHHLLQNPRFITPVLLVVAVVTAMAGYGIGTVSNSKASTAVPPDLNNDGKVNVFDLSILLAAWTGDNMAKTPTPTVTVTPTATSTATPISGGTQKTVLITFYGSYDNDPKGSLGISDPVIHQQAGGTGTYADPLTFASPDGTGSYKVGQKIYVPGVKKYFIKEDTCAVSWTAPDGCGPTSMVDLYVGNPSSSSAVVNCENKMTPDNNQTIILDPPSNLTVSSQKLWDQNTRACYTPTWQ